MEAAGIGLRPIERRRLYDDAVREVLILLWEASDRICGKRLKPLIPMLVAAMERHGHLALDAAVRERLEAVSAATIEQKILAPVRQEAGWPGAVAEQGTLVGDPPRRAHPHLWRLE